MESAPQYLLGYVLLALIWMFTDPKTKKLFYTLPEFLSKDSTRTTTIQFLIMTLQLLSGLFFPWPATRFDPLIMSLGSIMFWMGFGIAVWAKFTMKKNWGMPAQHDVYRQNLLVTTGPFLYTRNPIYVGLSLMALGASLGVRSILTPLVILFFIHLKRMVATEEQLLLKHFGSRYRDYRKQVPRFLL